MANILDESIWSNMSKWYPPVKYVFYPLYKFYRKKIGLNTYAANFATWTSSAVLHGALLLPQGNYKGAAIASGFFLGLGALSTVDKFLKTKHREDKRKNKTLDDIV